MLDIRNAVPADIDEIVRLESACFPEEEAASRAVLQKRLEVFPNHFWLLERDGKLVSMVNGSVSDNAKWDDQLYSDPSLHQEDGKWQLLFGVETDPAFRRKGYASILMKEVIKDCINDSRKGILLTCLDEYVPFYEKLGFTDMGTANSTHGGQKWHQMELNLEEEI